MSKFAFLLLFESAVLRLRKLEQVPIMQASQWYFSLENFFSRQVLRRFFKLCSFLATLLRQSHIFHLDLSRKKFEENEKEKYPHALEMFIAFKQTFKYSNFLQKKMHKYFSVSSWD